MGTAETDAGRVYLVGAGPGDPGLLTARALELIALADVILYDRLIPAGGARRRARRRRADLRRQGGRRAPRCRRQQTEALMLERALGRHERRAAEGRRPVRLRPRRRGGAARCAPPGVPFEVVPGVTAGVAAPAYAGIPVTHRDVASAVALITGNEDPEKPDTALDWPALAAFPGTLVFYMGVRRLPGDRRRADRRRRVPPQSPSRSFSRARCPASAR